MGCGKMGVDEGWDLGVWDGESFTSYGLVVGFSGTSRHCGVLG